MPPDLSWDGTTRDFTQRAKGRGGVVFAAPSVGMKQIVNKEVHLRSADLLANAGQVSCEETSVEVQSEKYEGWVGLGSCGGGGQPLGN